MSSSSRGNPAFQSGEDVIRFGTTFSHSHLDNLKILINDALDFALEMGFSHLRLGSYWQAIEKSKGLYKFSVLEDLLNRCEKTKQKVIMNVGVKSPRWPEFYWPGYLKEKDFNNSEAKKRVLLFIEKSVKALKKYSCITHWQVENEPLDPSGPENLAVPVDFLIQEVELVRKLDNRPNIMTLWADDLESRKLFPEVLPISDVIGLDLYYKRFMKSDKGKSVYEEPRTKGDYYGTSGRTMGKR